MSEPGLGPRGVAVEARWRRIWPDWALVVHLLTLVVGLGVLVVASRGHWFVIDEWVFITDRRLDDVRGIFVPHNEHWSTLPLVLWRALFAAVGLHSYWPYQLVTLAVHLGVAHLLWRIQRRAQVSPAIAVATSGLFVVFGAGAENILNAFAVTFDAPVLLGLGQVLLVNHEGRFDRRDAWGWLLALAGLMTSGVALSMVAVAGLVAWLRRGWRAALLTVAPLAALFVLWLALIGRLGLRGGWQPRRMPAFAWQGLSATIDIATSIPGAGVVALAGLAAWLVRHRSELRGRLAATFACALGAVVFFALIGLGRSLAQVELSRYLYVSGALLIPAVGAALSDLTANRRLARTATLVVVALLAANGTRLLAARSAAEYAIEDPHRRILLAAARLDLPPSEVGLPEPLGLAHRLTYHELQQMRHQGKLPSDEDVTRDHELAALAILHIGVSPAPQLPLGPQGEGPTVITTGPGAVQSDCLRLEPRGEPSYVLLRVPVPVSLPMYSDADSIDVFLRHADGATSPLGLEFQLWHDPTYLNIYLRHSEVVLGLPHETSFTLCGVRAG